MTNRICSKDNCEKQTKKRGLCESCYRQSLKRGELLRIQYPQNCSIEGCENKHLAKGYCSKHYKRNQIHNDPLYVNPKPKYTKCSIEGCENKHFGNGYCSKHYQRKRTHGDPLYVNPMQRCPNMSLEETIKHCLNQSRKGGPNGDCLEWLRSSNRNGYGQIRFQRKQHYIGRLILLYFEGEPKGRWMLHSCDNPKCINPDHLRWGTPKENAKESENRSMRRQIPRILDIWKTGKPIIEIANEFGVWEELINEIIHHEYKSQQQTQNGDSNMLPEWDPETI